MEQNNIKSSGMRALTQCELSAVSGGMWPIIPILLGIIALVIVPGNAGRESQDDMRRR